PKLGPLVPHQSRSEIIYHLQTIYIETDLLTVIFLSSYFTSLWSIIYLLSAVTSRAIAAIAPLARPARWLFDIKTKPLQSLGYVAGFIAGVATYAIVLVRSL